MTKFGLPPFNPNVVTIPIPIPPVDQELLNNDLEVLLNNDGDILTE